MEVLFDVPCHAWDSWLSFAEMSVVVEILFI